MPHESGLVSDTVLDVNSSKWQLDSVAAAKRGSVFWQLAMYDAWLVRHFPHTNGPSY